MLRGINRQKIFEDEEDKRKFLDILEKYKRICKFELYSYCLMDNHIHLLIKVSEEEISTVIKRISLSYVYWYNMKYESCGHLFQERFKSEGVDRTVYFLLCFGIFTKIHLRPV
ncbi:transposase [Litchfieldia alkalitelluris]|uniref:transposase n=1 Tax=Litchfieldia alkalitelluris TaxID=304268 RepID=UPI002E257CCB|nr:transposase [Litchfieldia alkalitelluris]